MFHRRGTINRRIRIERAEQSDGTGTGFSPDLIEGSIKADMEHLHANF